MSTYCLQVDGRKHTVGSTGTKRVRGRTAITALNVTACPKDICGRKRFGETKVVLSDSNIYISEHNATQHNTAN